MCIDLIFLSYLVDADLMAKQINFCAFVCLSHLLAVNKCARVYKKLKKSENKYQTHILETCVGFKKFLQAILIQNTEDSMYLVHICWKKFLELK